MSRFSNEFSVGLLAIVVTVLVIWGIVRTDDMPDGAHTTGYTLYVTVPSAEGIYRATPVRIAGVPVGSVDSVKLEDGHARVKLSMQGDVKLPKDSLAAVKGEGLLGDKFLRVTPGSATDMLANGDDLQLAPTGPDIDEMLEQAKGIADNTKAITGNIRGMTDDPQLREQIAATVANVEALSVELRAIAGENRQDLQAIAKNLKDVSEALKAIVGTTGTNVDKELATLQAATDTLDRTMQNVESISAKVDHGEGTVGKLLNDSTTIDSVNDTLGQVNGLVSDVSRLQTEVYYRGDYFLGTAPSDGSMETNPVSGEGRNVVGLRIQPREDYWYQVELVSHPIGTVSYEDRAISQAGTVPDFGTAWREYVVRPDYRFSFQFAKRINNLVLRFGVKESSGGVGADWELLHDHAVLSADLYDFTYGSWPLMDGTPNLELTARVVPWRHVYFEGGMDNVILGARHGFVTGFAGGGFTFDDQDLKYVLAALPLPM